MPDTDTASTNKQTVVIIAHALEGEGSGEYVRAANMAHALKKHASELDVVLMNGGKSYAHLVGEALEGVTVVELPEYTRKGLHAEAILNTMREVMDGIIQQSGGAEHVLLVTDFWPLANGREQDGNPLLDSVMLPFTGEMHRQGVTLWCSSREVLEANTLPAGFNPSEALSRYAKIAVFAPEALMHLKETAKTAHGDGGRYLFSDNGSSHVLTQQSITNVFKRLLAAEDGVSTGNGVAYIEQRHPIEVEHLGFMLPDLPQRTREESEKGSVIVAAGGSYTPEGYQLLQDVLRVAGSAALPEALKGKAWKLFSGVPAERAEGQELARLAKHADLVLAASGGSVTLLPPSNELKQEMANADLIIGQAGVNFAVEATSLAARDGTKVCFVPLVRGPFTEQRVRAEAMAAYEASEVKAGVGEGLASWIAPEAAANTNAFAAALGRAMQLQVSDKQKALFDEDGAQGFAKAVQAHFEEKARSASQLASGHQQRAVVAAGVA